MFILVLVISALIILISMLRTKHFVKSLFLSTFQGLTALFAINLIGDIISIHIPFNWFSATVGAVGGLPGVIFLLVNDMVSVL